MRRSYKLNPLHRAFCLKSDLKFCGNSRTISNQSLLFLLNCDVIENELVTFIEKYLDRTYEKIFSY